jgi:hypothetical protein
MTVAAYFYAFNCEVTMKAAEISARITGDSVHVLTRDI